MFTTSSANVTIFSMIFDGIYKWHLRKELNVAKSLRRLPLQTYNFVVTRELMNM